MMHGAYNIKTYIGLHAKCMMVHWNKKKKIHLLTAFFGRIIWLQIVMTDTSHNIQAKAPECYVTRTLSVL